MATPSLDRFTSRQQRRGGCWYVRISKRLSTDEKVELDAALADALITSKTISKVLMEDFDFPIMTRTIASHRSGTCSCE